MARTFRILDRIVGAPLLCAAWLVSANAGVITEEAGLVPSSKASETAVAPTGQSDAAAHSEDVWLTFAGSYSGLREASAAPFWPPAVVIFGHNSVQYDLDFDDPASDLADASGPARALAPPTKSALRPQSGARPDRSPNWAKDLAAQLGIATRRTGSRYSAISLEGDVAEIGLGAKAIRSIHSYNEISLADDAAMTGLKSNDRYNPISLNGDASDIGFPVNTVENSGLQSAAVRATHSDNTLLGYAAGLVSFISSRNSLPYIFVILIGYVVFAGIQNLIARLR